MRLEYLELGQIVSTHGVRGEIKVNAWVDNADFFKGIKTVYLGKNGSDPIGLKSYRPHKNQILMTLEGIDDVDKAALLKNKIIYMKRSDAKLPKGKNFVAELIDCKVIDADTGREYGTVKDIFNSGATDIYTVVKDGKEYLMPDIPGLVCGSDVDAGVIKVRPIKGIFDEAEEITGE